jgi:ethanolaminephosphotransferase
MWNVYNKSGLKPILNLVPFALVTTLAITIYALNPEPSKFPNFVLYFLIWGFGFACAVAKIIVAHVSKGPFPFWTPAFLPLIVTALRFLNEKYALIPFHGSTTVFLSVGLVYCVLVYLRLVVGIISQICDYLKISCFRVTPKRGE